MRYGFDRTPHAAVASHHVHHHNYTPPQSGGSDGSSASGGSNNSSSSAPAEADGGAHGQGAQRSVLEELTEAYRCGRISYEQLLEGVKRESEGLAKEAELQKQLRAALEAAILKHRLAAILAGAQQPLALGSSSSTGNAAATGRPRPPRPCAHRYVFV